MLVQDFQDQRLAHSSGTYHNFISTSHEILIERAWLRVGFKFEEITFMLTSCPNLEYLAIEIVEEKYMKVKKYWIDNTIEAYKCVKSHLKKVEITGFKGTRNELNGLLTSSFVRRP
ncbi:FBD protein [Medicago truncatula]|uniref:FBD protein n=1 Tax=Medicago truncatula TaxID=3880 RepID=G7KBS8_MEDTR|nr:FBD protein [Medicago truncatula]